MKLLDRWDRRNQQTMQEHNAADGQESRGAVAISSVWGAVQIAVVCSALAGVGLLSGELFGFAVAAIAIVVGTAATVALARDAVEDVHAWTRQRRRSGRRPGGPST